MQREKIYNVTDCFSIELSEINDKLEQLKNNKIYEVTHACGDGSLATNVKKIEEMLADLINKIEYGYPSKENIIGIELERCNLS